MNCNEFREQIYAFQDDELTHAQREACQVHLDACPRCAATLELEQALLAALRDKLPRSPAPPGLETRVRSALRREHPQGAPLPWYRAPWVAATAAALLLVAILVPGLGGGFGWFASVSPVSVTEVVTVVDRDCDRAGLPLPAQRRCTHPLHVNALRLADGRHWTISTDQSEYRYLLLDADQRGRQLRIVGDFFADLDTVRLKQIVSLDPDTL